MNSKKQLVDLYHSGKRRCDICRALNPKAKVGTMDYLLGRQKAKSVVRGYYNNAKSASSKLKYKNQLNRIIAEEKSGLKKYAFWETGNAIVGEIKDEIYGDELDDAVIGAIDYTITCCLLERIFCLMIDIIIGLIGLGIILFLTTVLHQKNNKAKETYLSKKDVIMIQNSKVMRGIITGCTIIIGAMWLLFVYIYIDGKGKDSLIPILTITFVLAIAVFSLLHVWNWSLIVEGKKIVYTNWVLKRKEYSFEQLQIDVKPDLTIKVYIGGKKIFVIDSNMDNGLDFLYLADLYKVPRMR